MFTSSSNCRPTVQRFFLQEEFNVVEKTLTIKEAKAQKTTPYSRAVLKNGRGENAQTIPEKLALKSEFPKIEATKEYKLGIGDNLTFSLLLENNRSSDQTENLSKQVKHLIITRGW